MALMTSIELYGGPADGYQTSTPLFEERIYAHDGCGGDLAEYRRTRSITHQRRLIYRYWTSHGPLSIPPGKIKVTFTPFRED